jgi:hypothetical protein
MSEGEPLRRVSAARDARGIAPKVASSFASTHHGVPRSTNDIDLVVDRAAGALERFARRLDRHDSYVSPEAGRKAVSRARPVSGVKVFVASAEDTTLAKLEWARLGESERQRRDVSGAFEMQGGGIDRGGVERWARELGVEELGQRVDAEGSS